MKKKKRETQKTKKVKKGSSKKSPQPEQQTHSLFTSYKFWFAGSIVTASILTGIFLWITTPLLAIQPTKEKIYVDQKANEYFPFPDGSTLRPYHTITDALERAKTTDGSKKIFIKTGVYAEKITLPQNTALYGMEMIIKNPTNKGRTLVLNNKNLLHNIHVRGGKDAVFVLANSKTYIINGSTTHATQYGIHTEVSKPDRTKGNITIINHRVAKNALQGIYAQKGIMLISNSLIEENGEEGIDLHHSMHTIVRNSTMRNNGESGLESEIQNNTIILTKQPV